MGEFMLGNSRMKLPTSTTSGLASLTATPSNAYQLTALTSLRLASPDVAASLGVN